MHSPTGAKSSNETKTKSYETKRAMSSMQMMLDATPFAGLAREITTRGLIQACLRRRLVERDVKVAKMLHAAGEALKEGELREPSEQGEWKEAGEQGEWKEAGEWKDLEEVERNLKRASETLESQAAKSSCDVYTAKAKLQLAGRLAKLCEMTKEAAELRGLDALFVSADGLAQAAEDASALEATVRAEISAHYAAIVASLEGKWGARKAHKDIEAFVIKQQEPAFLQHREALDAPIFELGEVRAYNSKGPEGLKGLKGLDGPVTIGVKIVLPRSFDDKKKGAVGANAIFYTKKTEKGAEKGGDEWVPIAGNVVDKDCAVTVERYRLLQDALEGRAELKEHIKSLLLARVGTSASESPWYEALSKGDFKLVALCHEQEDATLGLAMCQLATVVGPASMTAELQQTKEQIVATMRAGLEADAPPRYFTISTSCMKRKAIGEGPSESGDAAPVDGEPRGEDPEDSVESPAKRSRCSSSGREATVGVATDMEA